jgi:glycine/D-amino acid oxidase-like deaminating enzyme
VALFAEGLDDCKRCARGSGDVEVYPRPDGTVYVCGESEPPARVTEPPGPRPTLGTGATEALLRAGAAVGGARLGGADVARRSACHLPVAAGREGPIVSRLGPRGSGVFAAVGHACWGILQGPVTGRALAQLICLGEATCVDLGPYSLT